MCLISANSILGHYQHHVNRYCYQDKLDNAASKALTHWLVPIISSVGTAILGSLDIVLCVVALPFNFSKAHLKNLAAAIVIVVLAPFRMIINLFGVQSLPSLSYIRPYLCSKAPYVRIVEDTVLEANKPKKYQRPIPEPVYSTPELNTKINNPFPKKILNSITKDPSYGLLEKVIFQLWQKNQESPCNYAMKIVTADSPLEKLFHLVDVLECYSGENDTFQLFNKLAGSVTNLNEPFLGHTILSKACSAGLEDVVGELLDRKAIPNEKLYDKFYNPMAYTIHLINQPRILRLLLDADKENLDSKGRLLNRLLVEPPNLWGVPDSLSKRVVGAVYKMADLLVQQGITTDFDSIYHHESTIINQLHKTSQSETPFLFRKLLECGYKKFPESIKEFANLQVTTYLDLFGVFLPYISVFCEHHYPSIFVNEDRSKVESTVKTLYLHSQDPKKVAEEALCYAAMHGDLSILKEYLPKVGISDKRELAFRNACEHGQTLIVDEMLRNGVGPEFTTDYGKLSYHEGPVPRELSELNRLSVTSSQALYSAFFGARKRFISVGIEPVVERLLQSGLSVPIKPLIFSVISEQEHKLHDLTNEINECVAKLKRMVMPIFEDLRDKGFGFVFKDLDSIIFSYLAVPLAGPTLGLSLVENAPSDEVQMA